MEYSGAREYVNRLVSSAYVDQGYQALAGHGNLVKELLSKRKLPRHGWTESTVEYFITQLSLTDSNNFLDNCGVGEREGRIICPIVLRRHYRLAHGIGRSGDIAAVQPKAAGSSLMNRLTNALVLDLIRLVGIRSCSSAFVVPVATGMAIALCLSYFRRIRPTSARFVLWCRIDQKSCLKSIFTAGFEPIVIDPIQVGDELKTNLDAIEEALIRLNPDSVVCVITTTSCFAPRVPDDVEGVAKLCSQYDIPHLVNNAYGLQSSKCCHLLEQASKCGRVDVFVQSCDKNIMVPVGGAIVAGFNQSIIDGIAKNYPGRASASPSLDVLITLLHLGAEGYLRLLEERKKVYILLSDSLAKCAAKYGERLLDTKHNQISLAISLSRLDERSGDNCANVSKLGSMLFSRSCSGARVVVKNQIKTIENIEFIGFGSHCSNYRFSYLNAAAAIGIQRNDVDSFITKLDKCMDELYRDIN